MRVRDIGGVRGAYEGEGYMRVRGHSRVRGT